ncbi:MAG: hypothetical protein D6722_17970 [Bacteroidetes bacterium]|nr:MAG: hypothetical protein D6722_17970 [Bacteroidota bacterium]
MDKSLSADWFMEGTLDFEYKKYVLLAWLQHVSREFAEVRLYPSFSDLIFHYNNLSSFREEKRRLAEQFPRRLSEEEFRQMRLVQEPQVDDSLDLQEIEAIIDYAMPEIRQHLREGKDIYEYIDDQVQIEPVGLMPLYRKEGYLFLRVNPRRHLKIYEYQIVFFENTEANYHGISLSYLDTRSLSIADTPEAIKRHLVRERPNLPNPATYLLYAPQPFPEEAALLPVAKRKMLSYLKAS